jgi:hypothetical protein
LGEQDKTVAALRRRIKTLEVVGQARSQEQDAVATLQAEYRKLQHQVHSMEVRNRALLLRAPALGAPG